MVFFVTIDFYSLFSAEIRQVFRSTQFYKLVPKEHFFPSVGDAVGFVKAQRLEAFEAIAPPKEIVIG